MSLNLTVLPLKIVENLVAQKCLLPTDKFPTSLRPGTWAKCSTVGGKNHVVCQVYSRKMPEAVECCYLDECVSLSNEPLEGQRLSHIDPLPVRLKSVEAIEIDFMVTKRLFEKNTKKIKLDYLETAAHYFLQSLQLLVGCSVRSPDLENLGIGAIFIVGASKCTENTLFHIDESTVLHVRDVRLTTDLENASSPAPFYNYGFERVQQQLDDLLTVAIIRQTLQKSTFRPPLNALLVGPPGCGKSSLIAAFIRENKCNCFRIDATEVLGQYPGETEAELRKIFKAAQLFEQRFSPATPTIILLEDLQLLCPTIKPTSAGSDVGNIMRVCGQLFSLIDELYVAQRNIICLATSSCPENISASARRPGRFDHEICIDIPTVKERQKLFNAMFEHSQVDAALKETLSPELLDVVGKQTEGFVVGDLALLMRTIEQQKLHEQTADLEHIVKQALSKTKPSAMRATDVSICKTEHGFEVIGGMQALKRTLEISILAGLKQQTAFQRFGLSLPKGVLLYGPPGCAKTTIAKCLATEANMTFISTSAAEVYSPYIGCAEKFISKIFDTARKNAPCLIFLDEIDAIASRRAFSGGSSSDVQIRILSTLLTEMDGIVSTAGSANSGKHILIVGASNRPDIIDDALLRPGRFDKLIHVSVPDLDSRRAILELHAQRMPFAADVDLEELARRTVNFSGADICNLCNEAAMQAFQRDCDTNEILAMDFNFVLRTQKSSLSQHQINLYLEFENKFLVT